MAEVHSSFKERQSLDLTPEVELVSGRSACEALKCICGQIYRERTALRRRGPMNWTWPTKLFAGTADRFEGEQLQHTSHWYGPSNRGVIDSRHSAQLLQRRGT